MRAGFSTPFVAALFAGCSSPQQHAAAPVAASAPRVSAAGQLDIGPARLSLSQDSTTRQVPDPGTLAWSGAVDRWTSIVLYENGTYALTHYQSCGNADDFVTTGRWTQVEDIVTLADETDAP